MAEPSVVNLLHARLRRPPSPNSVLGSLPILFFGDLYAATVATVALNPSYQEYLDPAGNELDGVRRRLETLGSLRAADRQSLTDEQCERAIATMRGYFAPGRPVYSRWFRPITEVLTGLGLRYDLGQAAHLDLVQEATDPTWSGLPPAERQALRTADEPFLRWQLATFPLDLVICNGRTAFETVRRMTAAHIVSSGRIALVTWFVALAEMPERTMGVVGWNRSLQHPTGLGKQGHFELGRVLVYHIDQPRDAGCYLGRG
jgi:hypothetical protein